ncbi:hypothetical protein F2P81_001622 [Scophthalmus maximus]|uniref:Uncharacterized protein n=1 Tax=Scophthalmus maximus TaxID=52904 RepID=A0A6A4TGL7_SCOMX|nr:hypothetical protein F2P81_001622 [Scophthalmus maximus]
MQSRRSAGGRRTSERDRWTAHRKKRKEKKKKKETTWKKRKQRKAETERQWLRCEPGVVYRSGRKVKCKKKKGRLKDLCHKCDVKFKLHESATSISWLSIGGGEGTLVLVERETVEVNNRGPRYREESHCQVHLHTRDGLVLMETCPGSARSVSETAEGRDLSTGHRRTVLPL